MAKNVLFFKTGFHPPKQDGVARVPLQVNKVHQHIRGEITTGKSLNGFINIRA